MASALASNAAAVVVAAIAVATPAELPPCGPNRGAQLFPPWNRKLFLPLLLVILQLLLLPLLITRLPLLRMLLLLQRLLRLRPAS